MFLGPGHDTRGIYERFHEPLRPPNRLANRGEKPGCNIGPSPKTRPATIEPPYPHAIVLYPLCSESLAPGKHGDLGTTTAQMPGCLKDVARSPQTAMLRLRNIDDASEIENLHACWLASERFVTNWAPRASNASTSHSSM